MGKPTIIQRIGNAAEKAILSRVKSSNIFAEYYNRSKDKGGYERQSTIYKRQEIEDWTKGVMLATDPDDPTRGELMRFYNSIRLDTHLASVMDTRFLKVQRSSYKIVNENGDENEDLKELLERPWHDDLIKLTLFRNFQGTTLIELFDIDPDTMELAQVQEIPQSNFIAQKGIIINEEGDETGTSYQEGRYKDFYVQVGSNWELGMFNELATIVLAKKLGLGSWLSYIDKFGVPPIFAITERMDTNRRDELFDMLENFRMNHFAVLQGNEKIEVPNQSIADAHQSFKSLINEVCNSEISKRVLGGTGTVDEKSFVGSAEVHERVAQDRYEADKLLYKHYFNTKFRLRLAKLSSVYADFATHTLVWDNQETLNINGYIDAVQKLSVSYEFDVEEIRTRTGLPITGIKAVTTPITEPVKVEKKKPEANLNFQAPYAHIQPDFVIFAATWDAAIERLATQIYKGEAMPTDLDKDLVLKNYAAFNSEAKKAWGKGYYNESLTRGFRENFLKFAGAKSYDLINQLEAIKSGDITKEEFTSEAKALVNKHNQQWMNTELRFCSTSISSAQDYQTYLEDVDIYPNLKYRTMKDEDVRQSHAENEGIVKPVNEWKSLPPYEHGCRCWLEQTTEEPTVDRNLKGIKFHNNPVNSGDIFSREQSYFKKIDSGDKKAKGLIRDNTELMKQHMPYNRKIKVGDNEVLVNDFHDPIDGSANIEAAKTIVKELEKDVYVLPHIENSDKLSVKNPELAIGKTTYLADLKTFNPKVSSSTRKFIANNIKSANKQGCSAVVFDLTNTPESNSLKIAADKLRGDLKGTGKGNIKKVIIIKDSKVLTVTRSQLNQKNYLKHFGL